MKIRLVVSVLSVLLFTLLSGFLFFSQVAARFPVFENFSSLRDFVGFFSEPRSVDSFCYGDGSSNLVVVAYLDFRSNESRLFVENVYPVIKGFVESGDVQFCPRTLISGRDFYAGNSLFQDTLLALCASSADKTKFFENYPSFFGETSFESGITSVFGDKVTSFCDEEPLKLMVSDNEKYKIVAEPYVIVGVRGGGYDVLPDPLNPENLKKALNRQKMKTGDTK